MLTKKYEEETVNFFKKNIKPGMVIVDIGAHIGYYTRIFAKLAGKNGKVYGFEADEENFSLLKFNTKKYSSIELIQQAISDYTGQINFYHIFHSSGCHSIIPQEKSEKKTVDCTTLDDFLTKNKINQVDVIKIDIEGGESMAFTGMKKLLEESKKLIVVSEYSPTLLNKAGIDCKMFLDFFQKKGFEVFEIKKHNKLRKINLNNFNLQSFSWKNTEEVNVLFKK